MAAAIAMSVALLMSPSLWSQAKTVVVVTAFAWPVMLALRGAYLPNSVALHGEYRRVLRTMVEFVATFGVVSAVTAFPVPRRAIAVNLVVLLGVSLITRELVRYWLRTLHREGFAVRRVLAVGTGHGITAFVDRLTENVEHDLVVVGACAEGGDPLVEDVPLSASLPDPRHPDDMVTDDVAVKTVLAAIDRVNADTVAITGCSAFTGDRLRALLWALDERGVQAVGVTGLIDVSIDRLQFARAGSISLFNIHAAHQAGLPALAKDATDRVLAALGLIVLAPIMLMIGLAVRLTSRGPMLYRHTRLGVGGRPFTMLKFRTMYLDADQRRTDLEQFNDSDGRMFKLRNDPRITRIGRALRKTSIDELPQLVNVLLGHMSLVGPRPPLPEEVAMYNKTEHRRLRVRPGMTGLWQVSGRSNLSWEETLRLDLRYIDNWSLGTDAQLLWRTGRAVVKGDGAY